MSNVTHANENILVNLSTEASGVSLQYFSVEPARRLRVTLKRGETVLFDEDVRPDPVKGNSVSVPAASGSNGEPIRLTIRTADGKELIAAEAKN